MLDQKQSKANRLDAVEENKGDDEYLQVLYSTENSFTLSWPAVNRSITVDKHSLKVEEHDLYMSSISEVVSDHVCGFLGILQIYGLEHFVIATERQKVCDLPTYKQPGSTRATSAAVYALKKVQFVPFKVLAPAKKKKSKLIAEESKTQQDE